MSKILVSVLGILYVFSLLSCSTGTLDHTDYNYGDLIKSHTDRAEFYQGLNNVFQVQATQLNTQVKQAQHNKKSASLSWTDLQKQDEFNKMDSSLRSETVYFVSFYSPQSKINDLDKTDSLWRVFLDVNGKRIIGKVTKYVGSVDELKLFFPHHNNFATGYYVKFPISQKDIEGAESKLTLTSTIGSETLSFK